MNTVVKTLAMTLALAAPVESQATKIEEVESMIEQAEKLSSDYEREIQAHKESYDSLLQTKKRLTYRQVTNSSRLTPIGEGSVNAKTMNLLTKSSITAKEIDSFLKDTPMAGLGKGFVQAELETGVNALFLVSLAIHESNWGKSNIARDKNNLFGYGAYDATPYKSAFSFKTKGEGIKHVAQKIKESYLVSTGRHHRGSTLVGMNVKYSTDPGWSSKVANTMHSIDSKAVSQQDSKKVVIP